MPKISVIIPTYNTFSELDRCLYSIIAQSYSDWEIIICDDASTDGTWELVQLWALKEQRIKVIRNGKNLRAAATRNRCLEIASGEYIALQDSDDYSSPDRFEKQLAFLESNGKYAYVGADMASFDENGVWKTRLRKAAPTRWNFIWGIPFNHAAVMFRRSALDAVHGYRVAKETVRGQDLDLFMRLYAAGLYGYNMTDVLYFYNEDRSNFSRRRYRYRVDEAIIRFKGYCAMGIMPVGMIGVIKPLLVGLVPNQIMRRLKKVIFRMKSMLRVQKTAR